jgi:hypothetical protein
MYLWRTLRPSHLANVMKGLDRRGPAKRDADRKSKPSPESAAPSAMPTAAKP